MMEGRSTDSHEEKIYRIHSKGNGIHLASEVVSVAKLQKQKVYHDSSFPASLLFLT